MRKMPLLTELGNSMGDLFLQRCRAYGATEPGGGGGNRDGTSPDAEVQGWVRGSFRQYAIVIATVMHQPCRSDVFMADWGGRKLWPGCPWALAVQMKGLGDWLCARM